MSKLLNSVLDKVSENNNEYRKELQSLYKSIDEKTTSIIGDIVTLSNYSLDFSNAITTAKEELVNPISRTIESYVIKDLRSVETVNEQFIDKINDKLENADISTNEDKEKFINSLNTLLNEKYLEIVRIKRVDFVGVDGTNALIEDSVSLYINNLMSKANFDVTKLNDLLINYKKDIYQLVDNSLNKISNLYLNNFVNEVISSLNSVIDMTSGEEVYKTYESAIPNIPEINPVPSMETEIPLVQEEVNTSVMSIPEIPVMPEITEPVVIPDVPTFTEIPVVPEMPVIPEVPEIPVSNMDSYNDISIDTLNNVSNEVVPEVSEEVYNSYEPMEQVEVEPVISTVRETKKYDVEEILKIAKSPIINITKEEPKEESYLSIKPIEHVNETKEIELEFDEEEIVKEMIRRLSSRLDKINEKAEEINSNEQKTNEDEAFVNSLIENANNKKLELDELEKELDAKELELTEKQKDLDKKLNDVLPFANAIMKNEETN